MVSIHETINQMVAHSDPRHVNGGDYMKKVAIAIDVSGSIDLTLKLFATGMSYQEVVIPRENGGSSIKPVNGLAKNFDVVYFFTDGYFYGRPARNVKIVKLE